MVVKKFFTILIILLAATLGDIGKLNAYPASSGPATLKGKVSDAVTGESLPGANIFLEGTNLGAATDLKGEFQFNVPAGTYTLKVRYIGYKEHAEELLLEKGQTVVKNFTLDFAIVKGETVTITAQAEGQLEAINQQLASKQIKNIVSADRIQELPDVNAAESIGRLPGISITRNGGEANKVVIRGLSPKYNSVLVNGVEVPSTDRENRSVDLSMISSNLLSSIEVTKSLTPDMDANAIGGTINLKLKDAAEGLHYDIRSQGGYNAVSSEFGNYLVAGNISNRFFNSKLGASLNFNKELVNRSSEMIQADYSIVKSEAIVRTNRYQLGRDDEERSRAGLGIVLDYKLDNSKYIFSSFYTQTERNSVEYTDKYNIESLSHGYGVVHNREYRTDMFNNAFQAENSFKLFTLDYGVSFVKTKRQEPNRRTWTFLEENAFDTGYDQYDGGTEGVIPFAINDFTKTYWQDSDFRQRDAEETDLSSTLNLTIPYILGKNLSGKLKLGGKYRYKTRVNDEHHLDGSLGYNGDSYRRDLIRDKYLEDIVITDTEHPWELLTVQNIEDQDFDSSILNGDYDIFWAPNLSYLNTALDGLLSDDIPNDNTLADPLWLGNVDEYAWDYDFWEQYTAGYIMTELNLGKRLMILPGARYEQVQSHYNAMITVAPQVFELPNTEEIKNQRSNEYWFPQVQMRYKATDWFDIRLAATKTITRPDYRAISPYQYINSSKDQLQLGNPGLKPALAGNLDAFMSFYSNTIGLFTIGGFYKEIDDLVYKYSWTSIKGDDPLPLASDAAGVTVNTWVNNPHQAIIRGVEVDLQTNFWYLPKPFNNIVFNVNYSKINSSTYYPYNKVETVAITTFPFKKVVRIEDKRPGRIINQPDDILNVALGYDFRGFSGRLSCLYQGNTVRSIGNLEEQDAFTKDYFRIDLSLKQELPVKGLQIYCNLNNLTNEFDETYQYDPYYFKQRQLYGFTADIGLRFRY